MEKERNQRPSFNRPRNCLVSSQVNKPKKSFPTISQQVDMDVRQCIQRTVLKMQNSKMQTLQPPYFQKTLTKFRQQSFSIKLSQSITRKLQPSCQWPQISPALKQLNDFILNFDQEYLDIYSQQIREPYIRKIFNEGYEIDKVNFRKLNSEYELRKEIQNVLSQTAEWLIQLELMEDALSRIQLYFGIRTDKIMEKLKAEGAENRKGSWGGYFSSLVKKATSYALRKGSKVVQNTGYASMLSPAFAMLTWAMIGGSATLPWKGGIDIKTLIIPVVAFTVPYMLDNMAQTIQRSDFKSLLQNWAQQFQKINDSLRHFNELIQNEILACSRAKTHQDFIMHYTNLSKYVQNLSKQIDKVSNYDQQTFEEMKQRTKAYFLKYIEVQQGEWVKVMTEEQFNKYEKGQQAKFEVKKTEEKDDDEYELINLQELKDKKSGAKK